MYVPGKGINSHQLFACIIFLCQSAANAEVLLCSFYFMNEVVIGPAGSRLGLG